MKIAVLIDTWFPFIGGGQINAWEISKRLAQDGQNIELITRNCGKDVEHINLKNLKITKLGKLSKPSDDKARLIYLLRGFIYLIQNDFDLVVAHAFLPGLIARMFMVFKGKPAIMVVHGTSIGTNLTSGFKFNLEKYILTKIRYSAQITVSQDFLKIKNINKNIVYIPNGVDQIFFKPKKTKKRFQNALLFVGRLHPQKNLLNLVKAIKILKRNSSSIKLKIVGEGPQKQEISNLIKKYRLQKAVTLEGQKTNVQLINYYQTSTALILPSIYEGQPLTILEAWASKLPIIVSKTGDNTYLVNDEKNGYFIQNQNDPNSIADSIAHALKNTNLKKMGENGYNLVRNRYTWENVALATKAFYEKIAK